MKTSNKNYVLVLLVTPYGHLIKHTNGCAEHMWPVCDCTVNIYHRHLGSLKQNVVIKKNQQWLHCTQSTLLASNLTLNYRFCVWSTCMSPHVVTRPHWVNYIYSISQELYSLFTLCCVLLWFGIGQFYSYPSYQDYFTGIGATIRLSRRQCGWSNPENMGKPHKFAADCRYTHNKPKQIKTMYIHMGNVVYIYISMG